MTRSFVGSDRGRQVALMVLPVDARDVLPSDHRVWHVLELVAELDLSAFWAAFRTDGVGRPPYDPGMLLALFVYCYGKRRRSLREIRTACIDDLGARVIMGGVVPSLGLLSEFTGRHGAAIRALLPATLAIGEREGLVRLDVVAGDGTKVAANAAMTAGVDEATLRTQIADLEAKVAAATAVWDAQIGIELGADAVRDGGSALGITPADPLFDLGTDDGTDDGTGVGAVPGGGSRAAMTWRCLNGLLRTLRSRQEALAWLAAHPPETKTAEWRERLAGDRHRVEVARERVEVVRARLQGAWNERVAAQATGKVFLGPPMVAVEHHSHLKREQQYLDKAIARAERTATQRPTASKVNTTDPTSRVMLAKRGGYDQMFNVQAMACTGQFVLAVCVHDNPNDKQALAALAHAARANLDTAGIARAIQTALFDAGYASQDNITDPDLPFEEVLISVEKEARQTGRRTDDVSTAARAWTTMAARLAEPANAALYKRRAAIIEPLFAQLFQIFGRDLHTRGETVLTELHLWAITHNLDKITRARHRQRAA